MTADLIANIIPLLVVAGGIWVYLKYQKQQGNAVVVGDKKLN
jgi:hypothetical protein